jgi:hypothetical protein
MPGVLAGATRLETRGALWPDASDVEVAIEDWMGDEIIAVHPCILVTPRIARTLARFSGFTDEPCRTWKSPQYAELRPEVVLPDFRRLVPTGVAEIGERLDRWSGHELCLARVGRTAPVLCVGDGAMSALRSERVRVTFARVTGWDW